MVNLNESSYDLYMSKVAKDARAEYLRNVHEVYIRKGGDVNIIIYGLPEYLCLIYDPTSETMSRLYKNNYTETQLSYFVLSHNKV